MRKIAFFLTFLLLLSAVSCRQKKHDAVYYEQMIDSIRKAEQLGELQRMAGIGANGAPAKAFFDTLQYHSLPIQSESGDFKKIGKFVKIPRLLNDHLGYSASANLSAMALPSAHRYRVLMVSEMQDSITPVLYLFTLSRKYQPIDLLCIYEQGNEDRKDDFGRTYMDFYVTSNYEITLMQYYLSHTARKPELFQSRRYIINKEGKFEEIPIEL